MIYHNNTPRDGQCKGVSADAESPGILEEGDEFLDIVDGEGIASTEWQFGTFPVAPVARARLTVPWALWVFDFFSGHSVFDSDFVGSDSSTSAVFAGFFRGVSAVLLVALGVFQAASAVYFFLQQGGELGRTRCVQSPPIVGVTVVV